MLTVFLIFITIIIVWFSYSAFTKISINKKYSITQKGGWGGFLTYKNNEKSSKIEWERLAGGNNFVLYNKKLQWESPNNELFTTKEKYIFYKNFNAWANALKYNYETEVMVENENA